MKYEIKATRALNRKAKFKIFFRWFLYSLLLLVMYCFMRSGAFGGFAPPLIIPLATAVAVYEREFSGSIFGAVCGLFLDVAVGSLFGFTSVWLMPICLGAALLVTNLIKVNFLNHLWITASALIIILFMDYLFRYLIWENNNSSVILVRYMLPSYGTALLLTPLVYFIVKAISQKLSYKEQRELHDVAEEASEEEKK